MPLHFAFGTNMIAGAMAARCPGARQRGRARLVGHRVIVMREGWLSVARDPRRTVWGILWDLPFADLAALDRYEEVARGLYGKLLLAVLTEAGPRRALVYVGADACPGALAPANHAELLAAARAAGLPAAYVAELAGLRQAGSRGLTDSGNLAVPHAEVVAKGDPRSTHQRRASFEASRREAPQDEVGGRHGPASRGAGDRAAPRKIRPTRATPHDAPRPRVPGGWRWKP